jgi:hypothetical protein
VFERPEQSSVFAVHSVPSNRTGVVAPPTQPTYSSSKRLVRRRRARLVEMGPDSGEADWCEEGHESVMEFAIQQGIKL